MNKKVFTTKVGEADVELAILKPTAKIRINAQLVYNKAWAEAEKNGSPLARNLDDVAERHGVWNKDKVKQVEDLGTQIISLEKKLRAGANSFASKEEAKATALEIRRLRGERLTLLRTRDELYVYTAENFSDNARINYFVSQSCVYNDTGKPFFKSYDDFIEQSESEVARDALKAYFELITADLPNEDENHYEIQWLKKYHYMDDKGRLINDKGQYISDDGRLIDENYNYVDEEGRRIDRDGTPVDDKDNYVIEYVEFPD